MKKVFSVISEYLSQTYWSVVPFATYVLWQKYRYLAKFDFDTLIRITDMNDDVYKSMSRLGFKISDVNKDLRTVLQRGQVVPYAADTRTVENDAAVWINDQLASLRPIFISYGIADRLEVEPTYDPSTETIMFSMRSQLNYYLDDIKSFLVTNAIVTLLYLALITISIMTAI